MTHTKPDQKKNINIFYLILIMINGQIRLGKMQCSLINVFMEIPFPIFVLFPPPPKKKVSINTFSHVLII